MKNFIVTLDSDSGLARLKVVAQDTGSARNIILKAEGCPPTAIADIKPEFYYQEIAEKLKSTDGFIQVATDNIKVWLQNFHYENTFMKIEANRIGGNSYHLIVISGG